jgi:ribosome-binding protein aMBF1 (putative translation factor)
MAKYSTGGGGSTGGDSCELCGASGVALQTANVAGATLEVCSDCADHGETTDARSDEEQDRDRDRRKRAAQNTARMQDAGQPDAEHWESGANYDDDQLPYLVSAYGERLTEARQDAGLQIDELAADLEVEESAILAVEQGRATQAGVGGSLIEALEERLDVDIVENR